MVYVFLAEGFEEIEALTTVDLLRRCAIDVVTVGIGSQNVTGSHGITVLSDTVDNLINLSDELQAIVLPGGMPGTVNEEKSDFVQKSIDYMIKNNKLICAICAAPSILGHKELLNGKNVTCYPGFEEELGNANYTNNSFEVDGNIITGKGAGCTIDFALAIATEIAGEEKAQIIKKSIQCS